MRGANFGNGRVNDGGIDHSRLVARETKKYGAVRGVAQAGEGERSVERSLDAGNAMEQAMRLEVPRKEAGRPHGAHGMRAGRADADLVKVEETGHEWNCSVTVARVEKRKPGAVLINGLFERARLRSRRKGRKKNRRALALENFFAVQEHS
jgi:hypothetical protein